MKEDAPKAKRPPLNKKKVNWTWIGTIFGATIVISAIFSYAANSLLKSVNLIWAFLILFLIVFIGILFDLVGVAVTTAEEKPFHSMASRNVPEAKEAIRLIRNAERVSSFCNDVVGDICGIISGSASAVIAATVILGFSATVGDIITLLLSSLVSGLTVGGKAIGKSFAINTSTPIVHIAAKVIYRVKFLPKLLKKSK